MKLYKGYTYESELEYDDDCYYIYHYAVDSEGNKVKLHYSGWTDMTEEAFKTLVDSIREAEYTRDYTIYKDRLSYL